MARKQSLTTSTASPAVRPRREAVVLIAIAVPIVIAFGVAAVLFEGGEPGDGLASVSASSQPPGGTPTGAGEVSLVHPDSPTKGPIDAPVTVVEFIDPECESCRAAYPIVEQLLAEHADDVRLVLRYVPWHANSALAAAALEEAGRQGLYWEMLDRLFERQPEWGEQRAPQTEAFLAYGAEVGLDVEQLAAALESPDLTKVERDAADAAALGIRGTPTFFINGVVLEDLSEAGLRAMIAAALPG